MKLASCCYHNSGHINTEVTKKSKWDAILSDLKGQPIFADLKCSSGTVLKKTFYEFQKKELLDLANVGTNLSGAIITKFLSIIQIGHYIFLFV